MPIGEDGFRVLETDVVITNKIEVIKGPEQNEFCQTFVMNDEDHTLANALKHVIAQDPSVVFCGCTVPHPMERKINLRIQTKDNPAIDVLRAALLFLKMQNEAIRDKIKEEVKAYETEIDT